MYVYDTSKKPQSGFFAAIITAIATKVAFSIYDNYRNILLWFYSIGKSKIIIKSDSELYDPVIEWLKDNVHHNNFSLSIKDQGSALKHSPIFSGYNVINFFGQRCVFCIEESNDEDNPKDDRDENKQTPKSKTSISFVVPNNITNSFSEFLYGLFLEERNRNLYIYTSQYSSWIKASKLPSRDLSTISSVNNIKKILNDIVLFANSKSLYRERGILYKRCYLFYGPPGTGKSSSIIALANKLKKNVCIVNGSTNRDLYLIGLMSSIPTNSIIVFEDFDCLISSGLNREVGDKPMQSNIALVTSSSDEKLSLSAVLNCIDGLTSPEDVMFFMTTNYLNRLDPALLRPGRTDLKVLFDFADAEEAFNMTFRLTKSEELSSIARSVVESRGKIQQACLQECCLSYENTKDFELKLLNFYKESVNEQI